MNKAVILLAIFGVASAGNATPARVHDAVVSQANAAHAAAGAAVINAISYSQAAASAQAAARDRANLNQQAAALAALNNAGLSRHTIAPATVNYGGATYPAPQAPVFSAPYGGYGNPAAFGAAPAPLNYAAPAVPGYDISQQTALQNSAAQHAAARDAVALQQQAAQLAAINAAGQARNNQAHAAINSYADARNAHIQANHVAIAQQAASVLGAQNPYAPAIPAQVASGSYGQAPVSYAPPTPLLSYSAVASAAAARDQQAINNAIATQAAIVNAHSLRTGAVYSKV